MVVLFCVILEGFLNCRFGFVEIIEAAMGVLA